jgi:transcriptional regulator with XRE-family HTH domain
VPKTYRNLAAFLRGTHLTQEAFAAQVDVAPSFISMLVRGERQPSLPVALRIAERARIPVESLLTVKEEAPTQ